MSRFGIIRRGRTPTPTPTPTPSFYSSPLVDLTVTIGDSWLGNTNPIFTGNYIGPYYVAHAEHPVFNMGQGGTGLAYIQSNLAAIIALRPYVVVIDTGRNDFADDNNYGGTGSSNAVVLAAYQAYFQTQIIDPLKAALPGVAIVINSLLQWSVGGTSAYQIRYDANRGTWNTQLRAWAASGYIAAVADYAADSTLSNTAVYPDNGIHLLDYPTAGHGSTVAAPVFAACMDAVYGAVLQPARIDFDLSSGWSTGQNPPAIAITLPSDGLALGDFYRIEHSQNSFSTSAFTPWHQITSDDVLSSGESGSFVFTWDTSTLPTGATSFRLWLGRGADASNVTTIAPYPTNTLTDTLASSSASAILVGTTGPLKSRYINRPTSYQFLVNAPIGAPCLVAADQVAANDQHHLEWHIDKIRSNLYFGYFDGAVNFNTTGFVTNPPGSAGGGNGFTARCVPGTGEFLLSANGGLANYSVPGFVNGDTIVFEPHISASTVNIYRVHSGTPTLVYALTLSSQIPAAGTWRAFGGGDFSDTDGTSTADSDAGTMVPVAASWVMTPNTGYNYVYA